MKRTVIALITFCVAAVGSVVAFTALTLNRVARLPLTQYAWEPADRNPVGNE